MKILFDAVIIHEYKKHTVTITDTPESNTIVDVPDNHRIVTFNINNTLFNLQVMPVKAHRYRYIKHAKELIDFGQL